MASPTETGFITKRVDYNKLSDLLYADCNILLLNHNLGMKESAIEVPSSLITVSTTPKRTFIMSALSENNRAMVDDISGYNLIDGVNDICKDHVWDTIRTPKKSSFVNTTAVNTTAVK